IGMLLGVVELDLAAVLGMREVVAAVGEAADPGVGAGALLVGQLVAGLYSAVEADEDAVGSGIDDRERGCLEADVAIRLCRLERYAVGAHHGACADESFVGDQADVHRDADTDPGAALAGRRAAVGERA